MPRVTLVKTIPAGPIPLTALTVLAFTAADPANNEQIVLTSKDILIIWNSHASITYNYILTGVADTLGRTANIASAIGPGVFHTCIPGPEGFRQTGGYLFLEADNAAVRYAVVTFP